ncbi:hypothetical protein PS870_04474 [Pseudomonas fluorescens]|uniref:Glycine-rich domain-containing protein n=1 Tax=Pseudomonas fluorescens TaxID=294 RepID=A0A5E7NAF4_PSEFL|nr:hypothetical protein [Pseudomonas fluorescens]VVP34105.1 hypothetical protein PS870_04474 [Pseudomonas fluorescens]
MDYPISVPSIGLVGGKFVDEDPLAGTPGSLIPSAWGNAVTDEVLNVVRAAALVPSEGDLSQLLKAIRIIGQAAAASYAVDEGVVNSYVALYTPALTTRINGRVLRFKAAHTNTDTCTFNEGLGLANLIGLGGASLQGGEIVAGGICTVVWNSTAFGAGAYVLLSCDSGAQQLTPGTKSRHGVTLAQLQNQGSQMFTANGSFVVPAGITKCFITLCGGGGGGAAYFDTTGGGGGGGGAGAGLKIPVAVTPGATIAVTVGSGGAGGPSVGAPGAAGGASSFGGLASAAGGGGGTSAGSGGGGGAGSAVNGAPGGIGQAYNAPSITSEQGGMGGASLFGGGGFGGIRQGATGATVGSGFGTGGGGGCRNVGALGRPGFVLVEWMQ